MDELTAPARATARTIFLVDDRHRFAACRADYDPALDLVLTYDFALCREVRAHGGRAWYLDHLRTQDEMQDANFRVYDFFRTWHCEADGRDIFEWRGIPFGMTFRLAYWNDLLFRMRARLCLHRLRHWQYERLVCGTSLGVVEATLDAMGLTWTPAPAASGAAPPAYFFPIHAWMTQQTVRRGARALAVATLSRVAGECYAAWDRLRWWDRRPLVFVQEYHPTRPVLDRLRQEGRVRVVETTAHARLWWRRFLRVSRSASALDAEAGRLLDAYRRRRVARLVLDDEDVSEEAHRIVEAAAAARVAGALAALESLLRDVERRGLALMVLIGNLGEWVAELDCLCRARGIPTYVIANGLLGPAFLDDAKHGTVINGYGPAIAEDYFRGQTNVVSLGDPRMDAYGPVAPRGPVPATAPLRLVVGASGHSNIDLNSYVAVEFEFLHDVLEAVRRVAAGGRPVQTVVKVRANGYRAQYEAFVAEYAPDLAVRIEDARPIGQVLAEADVFVSIYSQTLFEASCLGVPGICYRKDREIMGTPFDGRSALVSVETVAALTEAVQQAAEGHPRFAAFLDRSVMADYVGPLDGQSTARNVAQIYRMVGVTCP